jgi:hypothetical protein
MNGSQDYQTQTARQIVDRAGMARGVIVLDADLKGLASALRGANIKVVMFPPSDRNQKSPEELLYHRIVVTKRPADFIDDADP